MAKGSPWEGRKRIEEAQGKGKSKKKWFWAEIVCGVE